MMKEQYLNVQDVRQNKSMGEKNKMIGKILFAIGGFIVGTLFGWQLLEKLAKFLLEKLTTIGV